MSAYKYVKTKTTLMVIVQNSPRTILTTHPFYNRILALAQGDTPDDELMLELVRPLTALDAVTTENEQYSLTLSNGVLTFKKAGKEVPIPNSIRNKLLEMRMERADIRPVYRFLCKAEQNPHKDIFEELFDFLEAGDIALTEDGDILAYKRVTSDYKDIYTNKIDHSPDTPVELPDGVVLDTNRNRTCSSGLHFAAWSYLDHYANSRSSRTVIVRVNPKDIGAIPTDYSNAKGRALRYHVLRDVTESRELSKQTVWSDSELRSAIAEIRSEKNTAQG